MRLQDAAIPAYHDPRLVVLSIQAAYTGGYLYDSPTVLVSPLIGILGSAAMLFVVGGGEVGWSRKFLASLLWELEGFRDCRSGQLCAVYEGVTNLKSDKTMRTTIWHLSVIWLTSDLMVRFMDKP